MAELLTKVAYLDVCKNCGRHATIMTSAGKRTRGFCSKKVGRDVVRELVLEREIIDEEARFLYSAVELSGLAYDDPEGEMIISLHEEAISHLKECDPVLENLPIC